MLQTGQEIYCRGIPEYNIKKGTLVECKKCDGGDLIISPLSNGGIMLGILLADINSGEPINQSVNFSLGINIACC